MLSWTQLLLLWNPKVVSIHPKSCNSVASSRKNLAWSSISFHMTKCEKSCVTNTSAILNPALFAVITTSMFLINKYKCQQFFCLFYAKILVWINLGCNIRIGSYPFGIEVQMLASVTKCYLHPDKSPTKTWSPTQLMISINDDLNVLIVEWMLMIIQRTFTMLVLGT